MQFSEARRVKSKQTCIAPHATELMRTYWHFSFLDTGAFAKVKESQRMSDEGKMDQDEADGIRKRCRTVGFALQAEMSHFHQQREVDFKDMMQAYLREQIAFYQRVVQQLERTLRMYDCL